MTILPWAVAWVVRARLTSPKIKILKISLSQQLFLFNGKCKNWKRQKRYDFYLINNNKNDWIYKTKKSILDRPSGEHCQKIAVSKPTQAGQRFTWSKTWCDRQQLWKAIITGDTVTRHNIPIRGRGIITWRRPVVKFGRNVETTQKLPRWGQKVRNK